MEPALSNFDAARCELLGPDADAIVDLIYRLNTGQTSDDVPIRVRNAVIALGWLDDDGHTFTPTGYSVADSIREYVFWVQRGRKLHCEGDIDYLSAAYYAGKSVLEVGCGFGCNLIPIAKVARRVVGIEPNRIYHDMSKILCEKEGVPPLDLRVGSGESLPIHDEVFDVVLCVSAHQYMDVHSAIREMARVVAPGGELQIVGGTLGAYIRESGKPILSGALRQSTRYAVTIANTLSYMAMGRRVYQRSRGPSTAYPIYPTRRRMDRWLSGEGLVRKRPHDRIGPETSFCFERRLV